MSGRDLALTIAPSMNRGNLTSEEWELIKPDLPGSSRVGRPALDHRQIINGILWVKHSGGPWRAMPRQYGHWSTVSSRYYRWSRAGVWQRMMSRLVAAGTREASTLYEGARRDSRPFSSAGPTRAPARRPEFDSGPPTCYRSILYGSSRSSL